jgi:hypothetical protein
MSISVQDIEKLIKERLPLMIKKTAKNFKERIDANIHMCRPCVTSEIKKRICNCQGTRQPPIVQYFSPNAM